MALEFAEGGADMAQRRYGSNEAELVEMARSIPLTGWGRLLLPGSKPLLHSADMASRPIKASAFGAHPQWTAAGP